MGRGSGRRQRSGLAVCAALAVAVVAIAPALAKSPPKHTYECTIGGYYADTVTIKSSSKYERFGKTGKYKAGSKKKQYDGYSGYPIKFKTGPFKGFKGNWHKGDDGTNELALKNPLSGYEDTYCDD